MQFSKKPKFLVKFSLQQIGLQIDQFRLKNFFLQFFSISTLQSKNTREVTFKISKLSPYSLNSCE